MRGYLRNVISHIVHNSQKLLDHFGEVKVSRNLVSTNDTCLKELFAVRDFHPKKIFVRPMTMFFSEIVMPYIDTIS